jgi:hypothetical protein
VLFENLSSHIFYFLASDLHLGCNSAAGITLPRHGLHHFQELGLFLRLDSPERISAGEARKLQVWNAAVAACREDQATVLTWLFLSGWPAEVDACIPWHLWDVVKLEDGDTCEESKVNLMIEELLSRYAILNPGTASLMALLEMGFKSKWMCLMAVREGRAEILDLVVDRERPCDYYDCLYDAAKLGHLPILERLWSLLRLDCTVKEQPDSKAVKAIQRAARFAAEFGQTECLQALLHWGKRYLNLEDLGYYAACGGHLVCLQALHKYVYPTFMYLYQHYI